MNTVRARRAAAVFRTRWPLVLLVASGAWKIKGKVGKVELKDKRV